MLRYPYDKENVVCTLTDFMSSNEDSTVCNFCLERYANDDLRRVKLRAVEFIRDYLNPHLIKRNHSNSHFFISISCIFRLVNRICINCIDDHIREKAHEVHCSMLLNSQILDIDYVSDSSEVNLTLQYVDQNGIPSIRITSKFLSITTIEQVIDYLIATFDLSMTVENLVLTIIDRGHRGIWIPIVYDRSSTLYQLDITSENYLRFEFRIRTRRDWK